MIFVAICDDQEAFANNEKEIIENYMKLCGYPTQIDVFYAGKDLLDSCHERIYDLVMLDLIMPEKNGMDIAGCLRKLSKKTEIIFVTAYVDYLSNNYRVSPVGFILKDDQIAVSLKEYLDIFVSRFEYKKLIFRIPLKDRVKAVRMEDIIYIESKLHYVTFYIDEYGEISKYTIMKKLDEIEQEINNKNFVRIHKSYLVNMRFVYSIHRYNLILQNQTKLPVAQTRYKQVNDSILTFLGRW